MDVDEDCGGGGKGGYELLCDDGFVYDQGFNSDDEEEVEEEKVPVKVGDKVPDKVQDKDEHEQPWLFLEESYEDEDQKQ